MKHEQSHSIGSRFFARATSRLMVVTLCSAVLGGSLLAQDNLGDTNESADSATTKPLIRIVPYLTPEERQKAQESAKTNSAPPGAHLSYFGGNVISSVEVVVVYWGTSVFKPSKSSGGTTLTVPTFLADVTNTTFWDLLTEYNSNGLTSGGHTGNQLIGRGTYKAEYTITPSRCTGTSCSDANIQAEITDQIAAGHLPAPSLDAHGKTNTIYMVYFPHGLTINLDGSLSCQSGGFCAYHGTVASTGTLSEYYYGVFPDFQSGSGCDVGCGSGATLYDNMTSVTSHELVEATTDAEVGIATVVAYPLAWYNTTYGEIGDICNAQQSPVATTRGTYTVQQEYSNSVTDCVVSTPRSATSLAVSAPSTAQANVPFNVTVTAKNSSSSPTTFYGGFVDFTSSDASATLPANTTLTNGAGTFQVTMINTGSQSFTATDRDQSGINGAASITVTAPSDLAVAVSHSGTFTQGGTGSYTITVNNSGGGATNGTVTLSDFLPSGLTASTMSGSGWSCSASTVQCSRADSLGSGGSYPTITLNVNISGTASGTLNNSAQVSGGAELNTSNDSATDPTTISTGSTLATMASPANGSTLTGPTQLFTWNPGSGASRYVLTVGTTNGGTDIYNQTFNSPTTSANVTGIPTNGAPLYVRLYSYIAGAWPRNNYTYTEAGSATPSAISSPTTGSTLAGSSQTFTWNNGGASRYVLTLGTTKGGSDIYDQVFPGTTTSANVSGIPTHAATVYATLYSYIGGVWPRTTATYLEAGTPTPAVITSPAPGTLSGSSQTFNWSGAIGATRYVLTIGTTKGGTDLYNATFTAPTSSATVTGLPTNGSTIYVTLYSYIGTSWPRNAYTYTTGP